MIVVSFLLVLVSLGLLVFGVLRSGVSLVAGSIAASLLAFGALYVGVRQRSGPAPVENVGPAQPERGRPTSAADAAQPAGRTDQVRVIDGLPHYHLASCQQLVGADAVTMSIGGARAAGFTPCGVCSPDLTLPEQTSPAGG